MTHVAGSLAFVSELQTVPVHSGVATPVSDGKSAASPPLYVEDDHDLVF